jgi:hypothetical protein
MHDKDVLAWKMATCVLHLFSHGAQSPQHLDLLRTTTDKSSVIPQSANYGSAQQQCGACNL